MRSLDLPTFRNESNETFLEIAIEECPNLQFLNTNFDDFPKELIPKLKLNFHKFIKFELLDAYYTDIDDEDLKSLFKQNNVLECFSMIAGEKINGSFFEALPKDTMKEIRFREVGLGVT